MVFRKMPLLLLGMMTLGCQQAPKTTAAPVLLIGGLDASGSARPLLGAGAALLVQLSETLQEGRDQLRLFRVERRTEEIYAGAATDGPQLLPQVVNGVKPRPEASQTFPAAFWQQAASLAKKAPGPVVVLLLTDGDNDDQTPDARRVIKAAAAALAACPNTRSVVVAGVSRQNRAWLREALEPALGKRLQLLAPEQMSVDTVRPALLGH